MAGDPEVSSKEFEEDLDVENIFQLKQYHSDAPLQITETPFSSDIPSRVNLLQISNTYGYAIIGTPEGFLYTELKDLRQSLKSNESELPKVVVNLASSCKTRYLALSSDELTLFVAIAKEGMKAELWIYDVREVAKSSAVVPVHKVSVDCEEIIDIRPNTGDQADLVALLGDNRKLTLVDSKAGNVLRVFSMDDITSLCWSPKGKQIAVGTATGTIYQLSSNGDIKQTIPPAADLSGRFVDELAWVHSSTFITFVTEELDGSATSDLVIVQLADKGKSITYHISPNPCFPMISDKSSKFYLEMLKNWPANTTYTVFVANANSPDIGVVGCKDSSWRNWTLGETTRASLPFSDDLGVDTFPLGLCIDLISTDTLPPLNPDVDDTPLFPMPLLYFLNSEGSISAYHCLNIDAAKEKTAYPEMKKPMLLPAPDIRQGTVTPPSEVAFQPPSLPRKLSGGTPAAISSIATISPAMQAITVPAAQTSFSFNAPTQPSVVSPFTASLPSTGMNKAPMTSTFPSSTSRIGSVAESQSTSSSAFKLTGNTEGMPAASMPFMPTTQNQVESSGRKRGFSISAPRPETFPGGAQPALPAATFSQPASIENSSLVPRENVGPITQEFINICEIFENEMQELRDLSSEASVKFQAATQPPTSEQWTLSNLLDLGQMLNDVQSQMKDLVDASKQCKFDGNLLNSDLLKVEAKKAEINQFVEAKKDPMLARFLKIRKLGPEQEDLKNRLDKNVQLVSIKLQELSELLNIAGEKIEESKYGRKKFKAPSLDTLYRSVRNLNTALANKVLEVEDLEEVIESVTLKMSSFSLSPSRRNHRHGYGLDENNEPLPGPSSLSRRRKKQSKSTNQSIIDFRHALKNTLAAKSRVVPINKSTVLPAVLSPNVAKRQQLFATPRRTPASIEKSVAVVTPTSDRSTQKYHIRPPREEQQILKPVKMGTSQEASPPTASFELPKPQTPVFVIPPPSITSAPPSAPATPTPIPKGTIEKPAPPKFTMAPTGPASVSSISPAPTFASSFSSPSLSSSSSAFSAPKSFASGSFKSAFAPGDSSLANPAAARKENEAFKPGSKEEDVSLKTGKYADKKEAKTMLDIEDEEEVPKNKTPLFPSGGVALPKTVSLPKKVSESHGAAQFTSSQNPETKQDNRNSKEFTDRQPSKTQNEEHGISGSSGDNSAGETASTDIKNDIDKTSSGTENEGPSVRVTLGEKKVESASQPGLFGASNVPFGSVSAASEKKSNAFGFGFGGGSTSNSKPMFSFATSVGTANKVDAKSVSDETTPTVSQAAITNETDKVAKSDADSSQSTISAVTTMPPTSTSSSFGIQAKRDADSGINPPAKVTDFKFAAVTAAPSISAEDKPKVTEASASSGFGFSSAATKPETSSSIFSASSTTFSGASTGIQKAATSAATPAFGTPSLTTKPESSGFSLSTMTSALEVPADAEPKDEVMDEDAEVTGVSSINLGSSGSFGIGSGNSKSAFGGFGTPSTSAATSAAQGIGAGTSTAFGSTVSTGTPAFGTPSTSAFGKPAFGGQAAATPAFGKPTFGVSSTPSAFGTSTTPSPFGKPSFGTPSSATNQSAFGKPSFGMSSSTSTPAFGQTSFGQPSPLGGAATAFGQPSFGRTSTPAFGSASPLGTNSPSATFGSTSGVGNRSGFATFASTSQAGFGSLAASPQSTNVFGGSSPAPSAFGNAAGGQNLFGGGTPFGSAQSPPSGGGTNAFTQLRK